MAICQTYLESYKRTSNQPRPIRSAEQIATIRLEELGHIPVLSNEWWRCSLCQQSVRHAKLQMLLNKGRCPGPTVWRQSVGRGRWEVQQGETVALNGVSLHATHKIAWYRGLYYCKCCGAYAVTRVERLAKVCPLRPVNLSTANRLKRIQNGLFPTPNSAWPTDIDSMPL